MAQSAKREGQGVYELAGEGRVIRFAARLRRLELKALQEAAGAAGGLECRHGPEDRNGCGDWVAKAEAAAVLQEQGRSKGGG